LPGCALLRYLTGVAETLRILDPTAPGPRELRPLAPAVPSLAGRVLGLRVDDTWQSFTHFADYLKEEAMRRWRVRDVITFDPGIRYGTTEEERRKVEGFVRAIDMAVVGLGT
jgi:hypothetical protein